MFDFQYPTLMSDDAGPPICNAVGAAAAEGNRQAVLGGEKVYFLDQSPTTSKGKWKERRVYLDATVLSYTDSSLLKNKRTLLQLTALSTVDVLEPGDVSVASPSRQPFLLKVEGETVDKKTCIVVFALSDASAREARQTRLKQAIDLIFGASEKIGRAHV